MVWGVLNHPNVVRFIGWMLEEGDGEISVSLISKWCDGGNVKDYLREHPSADRHKPVSQRLIVQIPIRTEYRGTRFAVLVGD